MSGGSQAPIIPPGLDPETAVEPSVSDLERARSKGRVRGLVAVLGPAFVASVAYVDPGNFASNIAAGSTFGYLLVWVLISANLMAMLIQYLSAKTGIVTGRNLPELCRDHFPRPVSRGLWVQAELVAMATDVAEFVGAALGLYLLSGVVMVFAVVTAIVVVSSRVTTIATRVAAIVAAVATVGQIPLGAVTVYFELHPLLVASRG